MPETVTGALDFALGNLPAFQLLCTANVLYRPLIHAFNIVASL